MYHSAGDGSADHHHAPLPHSYRASTDPTSTSASGGGGPPRSPFYPIATPIPSSGAVVDPSQPISTPAFQHYSRYLSIQSFSPSYSSALPSAYQQAVELSVQCILLPQPTTPTAPSTSSSSSSQSAATVATNPPAKTIRLCFAGAPVATRVSRAPVGPNDSSIIPGQTTLILSCLIPSWDEILARGRGKYAESGGVVPLHCEILGLPSPNGEENLLERLWFGDYSFQSDSRIHPGPDVLSICGWSGGPSQTLPTAAVKRSGSPLLSLRRISPQPHSAHHRGPSQSPYVYDSYETETDGPGYLRVDIPREGGLGLSGQSSGTYSYDPESPRASVPRQPTIGLWGSSGGAGAPPPLPSPLPQTVEPRQYWSAGPTTPSLSQPPPPPPPPASSHTAIPLGPITSDAPAPAMIRQIQTPKPKISRVATDGSGGSGAAGGGADDGAGGATGSPKQITAKASLDLQGDLNLMAIGWTAEEWNNRRRIVQFWRKQEGAVIRVAFRPLAQADYLDHLITVSCIYREDTNECYVTSVDTIYLLEALIGIRFSVEEKNRIRRNLEGLKPDTVSKTKPETEAFFKIVMGLSQPKPRNIEKDVKAFKWSSFGDALVKIIGKYSVAYDSKTMPPPAPTVPKPLQSVPPPAAGAGPSTYAQQQQPSYSAEVSPIQPMHNMGYYSSDLRQQQHHQQHRGRQTNSPPMYGGSSSGGTTSNSPAIPMNASLGGGPYAYQSSSNPKSSAYLADGSPSTSRFPQHSSMGSDALDQDHKPNVGPGGRGGAYGGPPSTYDYFARSRTSTGPGGGGRTSSSDETALGGDGPSTDVPPTYFSSNTYTPHSASSASSVSSVLPPDAYGAGSTVTGSALGGRTGGGAGDVFDEILDVKDDGGSLAAVGGGRSADDPATRLRDGVAGMGLDLTLVGEGEVGDGLQDEVEVP